MREREKREYERERKERVSKRELRRVRKNMKMEKQVGMIFVYFSHPKKPVQLT